MATSWLEERGWLTGVAPTIVYLDGTTGAFTICANG
ncbi:MAG: hypothetical protein CM1200mP29_07320 [Verrucomicrobiota bacterium]|nr:MAG: hypothetical protein CM1200mP29_07320 [Verrucomicrobiota bacterium]